MDFVAKQVGGVNDGLNTKDRFSRVVVHQYLHFQLFIILETRERSKFVLVVENMFFFCLFDLYLPKDKIII